MSTSSTNSNSYSENVLQQSQLEALKSLSLLLIREIDSLRGDQENYIKKLENHKRINLAEEVQKFETEMIRSALILSMGRQSKAAQLLGIKLTTLNAKIKRYKIDLGDHS